MSLADPQYPSSQYFDKLSKLLSDKRERDRAVAIVGHIYTFTLTNGGGGAEPQSWYIDLKHDGQVGKGIAPEGQQADCTWSLADSDFNHVLDSPDAMMQLYFQGKVKIVPSGAVAQRLQPYLNNVRVG